MIGPSAIIEFTDRDVSTISVPGATWFVVGVPPSTADELAAVGAETGAGERFAARHRNASVVLVTEADGRCTAVHLWRGLYCLPDIYYARTRSDDIIVSDHIRNVISRLPVEDRAPDDKALIEHYLTGFTHDRRTFCSSVRRVGLGDAVTLGVGAGLGDPRIFDRIMVNTDASTIVDVVERVEGALAEVINGIGSGDDVCLAFSGGVDSTLLASFFDITSPLVSMTTDSPEWATETEYARAAARLLDRDLIEMAIPEREFPKLLEETLDVMATPPGHYVIPMLKPLYDRDEVTFVEGEGADSVFGTDRGLRRIAGAFAHPAGVVTLGLGARLPGSIGYRSAQIRSYALGFSRSTDDPRSASGTAMRYGDGVMLDAIVGQEAVDAILADHILYTMDRIEIESPEHDRFHRHNEIIRWRHSMAGGGSFDRLMAQPKGKRIVQPYAQAPVIDALLTVPANRRYVKRLAGKWVLKEMLARRVPGYRVNQRKNATGIPFLRYCEDGPLVDVWDRYEMPDFIPPEFHRMVRGEPSAMTWFALTHAVWSERIGKNRRLEPHSPVARIEFPLAAG